MNGVEGQLRQLDDIKDQLNRMENRQEAIFHQTGQLTEFREEINEELTDVIKKEDMRYYEAKLIEHDKDLFNLHRRYS